MFGIGNSQGSNKLNQELNQYSQIARKRVAKNAFATLDFMRKLLNEDDWSFVIKSHALIETILSEYLTAKTGNKQLNKIFNRLDLGNREFGKLEFAKAYGIFSISQITFIKKYSILRNQLVHDVDNLKFTFVDYISKLNKQDKKVWKTTVLWFVKNDEVYKKLEKEFLKEPKLVFWKSLFMFIPNLSLESFKETEFLKLKECGLSPERFNEYLISINNKP